MKRLCLLFLVILFANSLFAQWEWQMPKPTGAALYDIGSFGPDAVFAVGLKGTIIKTSDGGNSFTQIESGTTGLLTSIYCIDEKTGWIGSDLGMVLRTTNAGENWVKVREPKGWQKSSFFALDQNTAWLSTENSKLLKTTDGGQNWENIETGIGKSFRIIRFFDAETGFALINESTPEKESFKDTVVVKTQDGGQHWDTLNLTFHKNVNFIETYPEEHIWIGTFGYILKSDDRGQTWDTLAMQWNKKNLQVLDVAFRSADSLWILARQSGDMMAFYDIFQTSDGGLSLEKQYTSVYSLWSNSCKQILNNLSYTSGTCWAVGYPGMVLSYKQDDTDWQEHFKSGKGMLQDIYFIDEQTGYAVGNIYTFLTTKDGGKNWEIAGDLPGEYGFRVYFISKDQGVVSIADEGLYRTNDGGKTWKNVLEKDDFFVSIVFRGTEEGWALHSHGEMYHTKDAGKTWQLLSTLPEGIWWDAYFVNLQTGFACGRNGIMKTSDGGLTWREVFNPGIFINSIDFIDGQTGWASGDSGLVCKTTDGGETWKITDTLTNTSLYDISFMNQHRGYLVSDGYGVFRSDDGGESWTFEPVFGLPMSYNSPGYWKALTTYGNDIWASYGCQILHKTDETVGIIPAKKIAEDELTIYPNPVSQQLFIESKAKLTEITILNLNGQVLLDKKYLNTASLTLKVDFLKPGLYFLKAKSEKGVVVSRFVKIK